MRTRLLFTSAMLALAAPLAAQTPAAAPPAAQVSDAARDLQRLLEEHYAWLLRNNPTYATSLGVRDYDDRLPDLSPAARERQVAEAQAFLARVEAIPADQLSASDRVTRAILRRGLAEQVEGWRFGQRDMLFTTYDGWHQNFAGLARNLPFRTRADFESYLTRIARYPQLNDQALAITANAVRGGYVLPCTVLGGHERTIEGVIVADPAQSRFYEPFAGTRPASIPEAEWTALQARARQVITETINPAYRRHLDFYRTQYLPRCGRSDSISALPGGAEYYAY